MSVHAAREDPDSVEQLRRKLRPDGRKLGEVAYSIYLLVIVSFSALGLSLLAKTLLMDRSSSRTLSSEEDLAKARAYARKNERGPS